MAKRRQTTNRARPAAKPTTSTAVATEEPAPQPRPWKMPKPRRGQVVFFYPRCTRNRRNIELGYVKHVGESSISLSLGNQGAGEVWHLDDPRIEKNPDIHLDIDGLWDFSDIDVERDEIIQDLESRIEKLEAQSQTY